MRKIISHLLFNIPIIGLAFTVIVIIMEALDITSNNNLLGKYSDEVRELTMNNIRLLLLYIIWHCVSGSYILLKLVV